MTRLTSFIIAAIMSFTCADFSLAQTTYPDGRPSATLRMEAKDQGVVLKHGDGPGQCDHLGAREALIFGEKGVYHLFYDGAGPKGWLACLAISKDLRTWEKKGPILDFGKPGASDCAAACSPWVYFDGKDWHMFYLGTPNTSGAPDLVPAFPYLTLKARSKSLAGPWIKQPDVIPFRTKPKTYYADTASPGHIVKQGDEYLMFFSASMKRTISIARTKDLNSPWAIDPQPIVPPEEQIENSSLYFEPSNKTWFLFTNHIGLDVDGGEYTDAVWVYWSKDLNAWDTKNKAVVLDGKNCTWSKKCLGMPSVVRVGKRLAIFYDAAGIPGEIRFIYLPRRNIYNWDGPEVKNLEPDVDWHVYYFDPATGRKFDRGTIKATAKAGDKDAKTVNFKKNVPSPQDWILVFEAVL